jgi:hypothetical protein
VLKPIEMRSKEGEEAYAAEQLAYNTDTTLDIEIAGLSSCTCYRRLRMSTSLTVKQCLFQQGGRTSRST